MSLEEAILEKVRKLPEVDKKRVLRFLDGLRHSPVVKTVPYNDRHKELEWIRRNRETYMNMWVSLDGARLIAADPDGHKVYDAAKAEGIETPFVHHIVPEYEHYWSGGAELVE
jgi:hypothetical protein